MKTIVFVTFAQLEENILDCTELVAVAGVGWEGKKKKRMYQIKQWKEVSYIKIAECYSTLDVASHIFRNFTFSLYGNGEKIAEVFQ